jgi:sRNA-binding protein
VPKRTGQAFLTVHRAKYVDVTTRIDLSGDFTKEVTLKKVDEADDDKKRVADEEHKRQEALKRQQEAKRQEELKRQQEAKRQEELRRQQEAKRQEELKKQQEAKRPKCQPPSHYNPFDTSCLGQPGASPTGACPACKDFK